MVNECVEQNSQFGMLLAMPRGIVRVGCAAKVTEVVRRYRDGRMDILTQGQMPFRVVELLNAEGYGEGKLLEGEVDYLDERESSRDATKRRELIELYEVCHTLVFDNCPKDLQDAGPDEVSFSIAGLLPLDLLWKQQILELRSEADRQERLAGYLREWAPHLEKREAMRARAGGNGIH
jgi:Lon protease-like protein